MAIYEPQTSNSSLLLTLHTYRVSHTFSNDAQFHKTKYIMH